MGIAEGKILGEKVLREAITRLSDTEKEQIVKDGMISHLRQEWTMCATDTTGFYVFGNERRVGAKVHLANDSSNPLPKTLVVDEKGCVSQVEYLNTHLLSDDAELDRNYFWTARQAFKTALLAIQDYKTEFGLKLDTPRLKGFHPPGYFR